MPKTKLYKNIKTQNKQRNKQKQNQTKEKERKSLELIPQNRSFSSLIFDCFPQSNLFTINKKVINNLKLKDQSQKSLNQKKIDLRFFCEKIPL